MYIDPKKRLPIGVNFILWAYDWLSQNHNNRPLELFQEIGISNFEKNDFRITLITRYTNFRCITRTVKPILTVWGMCWFINWCCNLLPVTAKTIGPRSSHRRVCVWLTDISSTKTQERNQLELVTTHVNLWYLKNML